MPEHTEDARLVAALLIIIGAFVIFLLFLMSFGTMGFGPMMGSMWDGVRWGGGTMPGWMFVVGIVLQFLCLATLVGGSYLLYRAVAGSESTSDRALEALQLAYVRGELTDDEYDQRRAALERNTERMEERPER